MGGVRSYPVPEAARGGLLAAAATLDQLDIAARYGNTWATRIVAKENSRILHDVLGDDPRLPVGVTADGFDDAVVALYRCGKAWRGDRWVPVEDGEAMQSMVLDADDVAFIARAFVEGADSVVMRPYMPLGWITAAGEEPADVNIPDGGRAVAVVDDLDRNAVMDLVVILPGPKVMRRHDGEWRDDDKWLTILRSVKPPPIVPLDDAQVASVAAQVDAQTAGAEWVETDTGDYLNASAWARADEMAIELALVAGPAGKAASKATPGGTMPANLRQYYLYGEGAARIRWGSPGAWRRCHRILSRYIGPVRARGACTNLGKQLGGHGVATHVSS